MFGAPQPSTLHSVPLQHSAQTTGLPADRFRRVVGQSPVALQLVVYTGAPLLLVCVGTKEGVKHNDLTLIEYV